MESNAVDATLLAGSVTADDFSMVSLFLRADIVVKAVMVLLILASVWSWAVIFDKLTSIRRLNAKAADFEALFWSGSALDDLYDKIGNQPGDPTAAIFVSAMREIRSRISR